MILRAPGAVLYLWGCPARGHVVCRPGSRPLTSAPLEAPPFMNALADLSQSRDLLVNLTLRELRGKYKRSVLGWSWSLLNPLATMVIFSVVFRFFPRRDRKS